MKWRSSLILAFIVVGLFFSFSDTIPTAYAQDSCSGVEGDPNCIPQNPTPQSSLADTKKPVDPSGCTVGLSFSLLACVDAFIGYLIKNTLLQLAGFFLWISANLLDYVINIGVLDFKSWAPDALYPLWQIVRQIISMFVVFSGLWLAFMYIINKSDVFKRYLPWVIIFGLFVNFSYPLTRAAIDLSNIVSLQIYSSAMGPGYTFKPINGEYTPSGDSAGAKLMSRLGLQGLVVAATANDAASQGSVDVIGKIDKTFPALLIVIYVLYATYIFFIAAGIIMMRTLALSFVIVASPLLFVDAVIPKLGEAAQKLRQILFEQLAVSVVFMVMLYLSMAMTGAFKNIGGAVAGGTLVQIFNVLMMLIVLHIMLKVTKSVSGSIGQMAASAVGKVGGFATGAALGVATGGAGLLARGTIGAAAARWSTSEGLLNQQNTFSGRAKLGLANMLANSSYDLRNTETMKVAGNMGGLSKGLGITGRLKNYNENQKDYTAEVARRAGSMTDERSRNDYINSQRSNTLQGLALGALGPKDKDGGWAKTSGMLATDAFLKTQEKEARAALLSYPKASKEERDALSKKASTADKNLFKLMEDYQAVKGESEADIEKKKALLVLLKNQGVGEDVVYNLINSDSSNELSAPKNRARNEKMRLAYADIEREKNEKETSPETEEQSSSRVAKQNTVSGDSSQKTNRTGEPLTLETETQVTARLDKQTQEALQQQIKANQDLNDLVKSFVAKNPGVENTSATQQNTPPQVTTNTQQPPTQTAQAPTTQTPKETPSVNEKEPTAMA